MQPQDEAVKQEMFAILERRAHQYGAVLFQGAFELDKIVGWRNCFSKITALDSDEAITETLEYDTFCYVQTTMTVGALTALVETLLGDGTLDVQGRKARLGDEHSGALFWAPRYISTQDSSLRAQWPSNSFWCGARGNYQGRPTHDRLMGLHKPLYPNGYKLIEHKMGVDLVHSDLFIGAAVFLLPNFQAKISEVKMGTDSISVGVVVGQATRDSLLAKVYAQDGSSVFQTDSPIESNEQIVAIGFSPSEIEVCLVNKADGELIDQRWYNPYTITSQMSLQELTEDYLRRLIHGGESLHVEFKEFSPRDKAKEEWAATAIAFANKEGGLLLIGVTDSCEIAGAPDDLVDAIRQSIVDRSEPPIEPAIQRASIDGCSVYVVQVKEGSNKPYMSKGKGIHYIRSAGSDRRMTRYELDGIYSKRAQQGEEGIRNPYPY